MATYEDLIAAARKADEAGEADDARRLLEMAVALRGPAGGQGERADPIERMPDGTPADMFYNPETGQMTSRGLLRGNVTPSRGMAAVGSGMQGLGFRFGDDLMGALGYFEGGGDMARLRREQARATLEANQEAYPITSAGAEVAGGITSSLGLGSALGLGRATTTGTRALEGAKLGALEGGLFGLGEGEGFGDRATDAVKYAGTGAMIGAVAPYAVEGARSLYNNALAGPLASMRSSPSYLRASRAVQTALDRSGRSADEVQAAIDAARKAGQPYSVVDALGNSGQRMLSGVARRPGDARQEIIEYLAGRQDGQAGRVAGAIDDALLSPQNTGNLPVIPGANPQDFTGMTADQVAEFLTRARGRAADTAYSAARESAGPVDVRGVLAAIDDRIGPLQGSGVAGDAIDDVLLGVRRRLAAPEGKLPPGVTAMELSDFSRVLGVKQEVQDMIGTAVRQGQNNRARELGKIMTALDQALEAASPAYRAANDSFATASRVIDQIPSGRAAAAPRARTADTLSRYGALTPDEQAAFRAGYSDPLMARIENAAPGVNVARPLTSEGARAELGAMARDPEALQDFLARETDMFRTTSAATGGSMTADNLADIAEMGAFDVSPIVNALAGRWSTALQQIGGNVGNALAGRNTATSAEIGRLLLSSDVVKALAPAVQRQIGNAARSSVVEALARSMGREMLPF